MSIIVSDQLDQLRVQSIESTSLEGMESTSTPLIKHKKVFRKPALK
jgi:hypothetical protein